MNIEALKLIRIKRVDIRRSLLFEFFVPSLSINPQKPSINFNSMKETGNILFFKKLNGTKQPCIGTVEFKNITLNNTSFTLIKIRKKILPNNNLEILINNNYKFIACNQTHARLNIEKFVFEITAQEALTKYVLPFMEEIKESKFMIKTVEKNIEALIIEKESIINNHKIISIKFIER